MLVAFYVSYHILVGRDRALSPDSVLGEQQKGTTLGLLRYLYTTNGRQFDINAIDHNLWTALHCAAKNGHLDVCLVLLKTKDINVNIKNNVSRSRCERGLLKVT